MLDYFIEHRKKSMVKILLSVLYLLICGARGTSILFLSHAESL